jgi:hypothetical protein
MVKFRLPMRWALRFHVVRDGIAYWIRVSG